MDTKIQVQVEKVRKLSRFLRAGCTCLIVILALLLLVFSLILLPGTNKNPFVFGAFKIPAGHMTLAMAISVILLVGTYSTIAFRGLLGLRELFLNFSAGWIYTKENVQLIGQLGRLALLLAVLQFVQPAIEVTLIFVGVFDKSMVVPGSTALQLLEGRILLKGIGPFLPFMMAGLVILASWIMEVGRQTKEEAEHMHREAELVV